MAVRREPSDAQSRFYRKGLGFVRLYLDDIDGLLEMIRARTESATLISESGSVTFDSADDLKGALPSELQSLAIEVTQPAMTVQLGRNDAKVYSYNATDKTRLLGADIEDHLARHAAPEPGIWWRAFRQVAFLVAIGLAVQALLFAYLLWAGTGLTPWTIVSFIVGVPCLILFCAIVARYSVRNRSGVFLRLQTRAEARSTATSRRGKILGQVGILLGAAALSYVGGLLTPR